MCAELEIELEKQYRRKNPAAGNGYSIVFRLESTCGIAKKLCSRLIQSVWTAKFNKA